jgi:hypothetical protein
LRRPISTPNDGGTPYGLLDRQGRSCC